MLLDNRAHGTVISELKKNIKANSKLAILTGLFSIYGFHSLRKELSALDTIRLMYSRWDKQSLHTLSGTIQETQLKNKLTQSHIAKECATWIKKNVNARAIKEKMEFPPQNMFHLQNNNESFVIQGGSHFTASGLGEIKSDMLEINMGIYDTDTTNQLLQWFNTLWNDNTATQEIQNELLTHLDYLAQDKPANLIYFITLYNIFKNYLADIDEENLIRSKTGIKNTLVWNKLYKFQRDGVIGAIDKLEKYNGCIIADSVGLGKTFEALAIIKYYELRNDRVLVLCPKKLRENWSVYTINDNRNLLASDRFNYDILNHTDLSRQKGKSGEINLETLNWGNYDLLVVDESHNFRNSGTKAEGVTRYKKLMDKIIKSGVKTKVLMLSATPVNNRMNDLKNQIAFITEGNDTAYKEQGITSIHNTLKKAQTNFNQWLKLSENQRKTYVLLENINFDYFKLLDLLTIARSRKHIEKYYDVAEIGKFPERLKPINIKADIDTNAQFPPLNEVNIAIKKLNLAAYTPLKYVRMDKKEEYNRRYDQKIKDGKSTFRQTDREQNLIHLMRVNLLKRLESSIDSFGISLMKLSDINHNLLTKIEEHKDINFEDLRIEDIQIDDPYLEDHLIGNKTKVLIQDMDLIRWKEDLQEDRKILDTLWEQAEKITPSKDAKLLKLKEFLEKKTQTPINTGNNKAIIFTAFADTAEYLYKELSPWLKDKLGLESALITGQSRQCTIQKIDKDFNNLLTHFSPLSKERNKTTPDATTEIDILIATDCISEGQNLQDCDMLINYDIHWNPVRIIQRFGRVDRLGSHNAKIQLANFWPNIELDEYINLEARVSGRMVLLDISATGEENLIDYDEKKQMNDLEYRRHQMEQLQDSVLDLEDMDGNVSITDMTLNDFRMDLSGFMKDNMEQLESTPSGFYATISQNGTNIEDITPGAIFCLKDIHGKVELDPHYALSPYYIVYVAEDGTIIYNHLQSKKSLDIFKKLCSINKTIDTQAVANLNKTTQNGKNMSTYQYMLEATIQSIIGKTEEKGIESLFSRGGTSLTQDNFSALEDFEVISYLIIKEVNANANLL
jgi:SNF2 family DNA or RNA helicase